MEAGGGVSSCAVACGVLGCEEEEEEVWLDPDDTSSSSEEEDC